MVCQTVKIGMECIFMGKNGCTYNGGRCHPIVDQCRGCDRVVEYPAGLYCKSYSEPRLKWSNGPCSLATHAKKVQERTETKKINPLKASKRNSANR
jgi:hypothetical protein